MSPPAGSLRFSPLLPPTAVRNVRDRRSRHGRTHTVCRNTGTSRIRPLRSRPPHRSETNPAPDPGTCFGQDAPLLGFTRNRRLRPPIAVRIVTCAPHRSPSFVRSNHGVHPFRCAPTVRDVARGIRPATSAPEHHRPRAAPPLIRTANCAVVSDSLHRSRSPLSERLRPFPDSNPYRRARIAPSQPTGIDPNRPEPAANFSDCVTRSDPARSTTGSPSDRLGSPRRPIGTAPNFPGHPKPSVANDSEPQPAATDHPSRTPSNRSLPPSAPALSANPRSRPAGPLPETPRQKNRSSFRRRPPPTTASRSTIPVTASAASCHRLARNCRR